jgi:tetratricopeptide (TPR) repeat protein
MSVHRSAIHLAAVVLCAAASACAGAGRHLARPSPGTLPPGDPLASITLGDTDAWLRHYLMAGAADSAVRMLEPGSKAAPRDELLRQLQLGIVLHHAGRWAESNAAFEWAEAEAESRWTRSVTEHAGTLLVNDATVGYTPPPGELAMIPYYRMLNYMGLGSTDGTLVEARKADALFARLSSDKDPCVGEGLLHYFTGLVYRGAGERNDALVSYRQAERAFAACGEDEAAAPEWLGADLYRAALDAGVRDVADSAAARYGVADADSDASSDAAELVVFVEHGWVAHRASADIHVPIFPRDVEGVDGYSQPSVLDAAGRIGARLAGNLIEQAEWGSALDEHPVYQVSDALEGAYILKLAWPVYRLEACAAPAARVVVDDRVVDAPVAGDLSAVLYRRWRSQRPGMVTRMVGRGLTKYLISRGLEKEAEKKDEGLGWLTGRVTNLLGNALERADTRSWSLLPDRISVARMKLPPGEHHVRIELVDEDGGVGETVDLGTVTLVPRGTLILNRRVWGTEMGDVRRLAGRRGGEKTAVAN